jgi:hypothetical protein
MKRGIQKLSPKVLLAAFVALGFLIAIFIVPDFGVSIDEGYESDNARLSLDIYLNRLHEDPFQAFDQIGNANGNIKYYGTASLVLVRWFNEIFSTEQIDRRFVIFHFGYFAIFQLGVIGMYFLARSFLKDWESLFVAVLFGTQPLLWGHAFINPKDIPLLTMFIWVVAAGFRMVDHWQVSRMADFPAKPRRPVNVLVGVLAGLNLLLWLSPVTTRLVQGLVRAAYQAEGEGLLGGIFSALTTSGSLAGYQVLGHIYMLQVYKWLGLLALLVVIFLILKPERSGVFSRAEWVSLVFAAGLWGLAISTRTVALFSGGIVGIYALVRLRAKALPGLTIYTLTAALINFISWPYLWVYGVRGVLESLLFFSDHVWKGEFLFEGQFFSENALPRHYLPKLIAIQFTEPLVLLALIGLILFLLDRNRETAWRTRMILLLLWLVLPITYVVIARPVMYNNFRQFLFITPPLFVLAGVGLGHLFGKVRSGVIRAVLAALILLPGIVAIIQLHPLQYSYYNQLVGGFSGAVGSYQIDYWDTGWAELNHLVSVHIPPDSRVLIWRDTNFANRYFEERYQLERQHSKLPIDMSPHDYALVKFDRSQAMEFFAHYPVLAELEINGVVLYTIYQNPRNPDDDL